MLLTTNRRTPLEWAATRRLGQCACTPVQSMRQNASGKPRPVFQKRGAHGAKTESFVRVAGWVGYNEVDC